MQNAEDKSSIASAAPRAQPIPFARSSAAASASPLGASRKQAFDDAHHAVDGAAQAGDDLLRRFVDGAHAAIDELADAAGPTVDHIAGALSNPSAKASNLLSETGDKKDAWASNVRDIVREHPIAAIAIALAAGAVYAKFTAAPSRDPRHGLDD